MSGVRDHQGSIVCICGSIALWLQNVSAIYNPRSILLSEQVDFAYTYIRNRRSAYVL